MNGSRNISSLMLYCKQYVLITAYILAFVIVIPMSAYAKGPQSVADLAEQLIDSVVNISTSQKVRGSQGIPMPEVPEGSPFREFFEDFFNRQQNGDGAPRRVQSLGSGFVIDADGIVITNNHVIEDADEIIVNFNDGSKLKAEVLGRDKKTDIAVLKVEPSKSLKAVQFGDSADLRVGDWVMAIGNPFGLGGTVTTGIVSARNRNINAGPYDNFIQTDAAINRGNSGGPLFDMEGRVIGINTAIISPSGGSIGIGFSIPSSIAVDVIKQLRAFGETRRGWLGVRIQEVTDELAEGLGLDKAKGALVAGITKGGPADKAGINVGDVIIEFNGQDVKTMRLLPRIVASTSIGSDVAVKLLRKGKEIMLDVHLGRLEKSELHAASDDGKGQNKKAETENILGLTLASMTEELRQKYNLDQGVGGVLITDLNVDSVASEKQIQPGEVIVEVAQEEVHSPEDVIKRVKKLKADGRKSVLLLIAGKGNELRFVAIPLKK